MDKILTVVIPAYNVEKFLHHTLDSFVEPSIMSDIEILIVDDGSKDHTAEIGKQYEERYPSTFRLISKENGGHGSTINVGVREAAGKYFKVVDGDDWVNTSGFVQMLQSLKSCDSDFVFTNYYKYYDDVDRKEPVTYDYLEAGKEYNFADVCNREILQMHALTIKTSILKNNNIMLDEHCFYVDAEYIVFPVPYVHTITFFDCFVYMYRLALDTQSVSISGFQKHVNDHLRVCCHLLEFAKAYKASENAVPAYVQYIEKRAAELICTQSTIYSSFPWDDQKIIADFKAFDEKVKSLNADVYALSNQLSKKLLLLRKTNFKFYKLIQKMSANANANRA